MARGSTIRRYSLIIEKPPRRAPHHPTPCRKFQILVLLSCDSLFVLVACFFDWVSWLVDPVCAIISRADFVLKRNSVNPVDRNSFKTAKCKGQQTASNDVHSFRGPDLNSELPRPGEVTPRRPLNHITQVEAQTDTSTISHMEKIIYRDWSPLFKLVVVESRGIAFE
jgi:hypothetical protein